MFLFAESFIVAKNLWEGDSSFPRPRDVIVSAILVERNWESFFRRRGQQTISRVGTEKEGTNQKPNRIVFFVVGVGRASASLGCRHNYVSLSLSLSLSLSITNTKRTNQNPARLFLSPFPSRPFLISKTAPPLLSHQHASSSTHTPTEIISYS
jgi:hypothetical protein